MQARLVMNMLKAFIRFYFHNEGFFSKPNHRGTGTGYFRIRNTLIRLDPDGAKESLPKFNFLLKFVL